jgi:malonate transporter MadL subunit
MIIYGVALLAICMLAGVVLGDLLGVMLGVKSNVGGVGIAMILLICARLWMEKRWSRWRLSKTLSRLLKAALSPYLQPWGRWSCAVAPLP